MGEIAFDNCRLCYNHPGVYQLQTNKELIRQICECLKIKINDKYVDSLPHSVCEKCNKIIQDFRVYKEQVKSVDRTLRKILIENLNKCEDQNETYKEEFQVEFKCQLCPASFHNEFSLQDHIGSHSIVQKFQCKSCKKVYRTEQNFQNHACLQKYCCLHCSVDLKNFTDYKNHICKIETPLLKDETVQVFVLTDDGDILQKEVTTEEITTFACNQCEEDDIQEHKKKHYKTYNCTWPNCNKSFKSCTSLKNHINKHEGTRSHLCVSCGKSFLSRNSLLAHEKTHAEIKGFWCNICDKRFSIRSNLRLHERKYHEGLRFYCAQCGLSYLSKASLERHEKIHTGIKEFPCNLCAKGFYTNKELLKHKRYHEGVRLYKCDECFKSFFEKHHLTIHLRLHSGERPYPCKFPGCEKAYVERQKLKRHYKAKHGQSLT